MDRHRFSRSVRAIAFVSLLVACGSRTGLFSDEPLATNPVDAGFDGPGRDASIDRNEPIPDALPPLDVQPPVDVNRNDCPDADATLIYVVTTNNELFSFYPPDAQFKFIGNLVCPAQGGATPFSMAVDRKGVAYVVFNDGELFRVSTATAACVSTPYAPGQRNFQTFGMGFATVGAGPTEALFIAGDAQSGSASGLGRINVPGFSVDALGNFFPTINRAELTGTGDGRLFAFYSKPPTAGSFIGEINTANAAVTAETAFPTIDQGNGWAFAFWGGDFYMFTAPRQPTSQVTRFRPADNTVTPITDLPTLIVGAGVSTCAPQQ